MSGPEQSLGKEWCMDERCEYRHWQSGPMPTHRRGAKCPTEQLPAPHPASTPFDKPESLIEETLFPMFARIYIEGWEDGYREGY